MSSASWTSEEASTLAISSLGLADIARVAGGASISSVPEVDFRIIHGPSAPTRGVPELQPLRALASLSGSGIGSVDGFIGFEANGAFGAVATFHDSHVSDISQPTLPLLASDTWHTYSDRGAPQPRFLYERRQLLEGILTIQPEPRFPDNRLTQALGQAACEVARVSRLSGNPLLMLHCPNEAPPARGVYVNSIHERSLPAARSSSTSVRFAIALGDSSSEAKMRLVSSLAEYAAPRGVGLWLGDSRIGYRSGNWFNIVPNKTRDLARYLGGLAVSDNALRTANAAHYMLPLTIFGPARIGTSEAVLKLLSGEGTGGLYSATITSLDDLAFIHLQLPLLPSGRTKNEWMADVQNIFGRRSLDCLDAFPSLLRLFRPVSRSGRDEKLALLDALGPARDYQVTGGPPVRVSYNGAKYVPVWGSWHIAGPVPTLQDILGALARVLRLMNLAGPDAAPIVTEYVIARNKSDSGRRGRIKLGIHPSHLQRWAGREHGTTSAALCNELEARWRILVQECEGAAQVSVGDREYRVGYGSGGL